MPVNQSRSRIKQKLPFLGAVVALVPSVVVAVQDGDLILAMVISLLVLLNITALRWNERYPMLSIFINLGNALVSFILAIRMFEVGKKGLPYAYLAAVVGFLIATYIEMRQKQKRTA